ncbi:MAG TPA: hypothetical protein DGT21_18950 [Armatimonadetes bacterium]|nr:hypothetical protein [Armatimonadota bacterium]
MAATIWHKCDARGVIVPRSRRGMTIARSRRGMTLLELMIAMLVLLVGIWTIAAGFPKLLTAVRSEGERTSFWRLAEERIQHFKENEASLPFAIAGDPSIDPVTEPDDFDDPGRIINAQESVLDVKGEGFVIPGAQVDSVGTGVNRAAVYVLQQGPAEWSSYPSTTSWPHVYMLVPLQEQRNDPRGGANPMLTNSFYVDEDTGEIVVPSTVYTYDGTQAQAWGVDELMVNYAWAEVGGVNSRPPTHYVQDERAVNSTTAGGLHTFSVRAKARETASVQEFDCLLAGKTSVQAIVYFDREPYGVALPTGRGRYVLENTYGVELLLHRDDAGLKAYVDYRLRDVLDCNNIGSASNPSRRKLMMIEEHVISAEATRTDDLTSDRYADIKLTASPISDDPPLFSQDLSWTDLANDVFVLAVDLTTGQIYDDQTNFTLFDATLSPALENGYRNGIVAVRLDVGGVRQPYVGNTWRFYYSTLNYHNVQLQKPARTFMDITTAECYTGPFLADATLEPGNLAQVDYRTYQVVMEPSAVADMDQTVLEFVAWCDTDNDTSTDPELVPLRAVEGHTVSVDYAWYDTSDMPHYVYGELHTIPPGSNRIALLAYSYHRSDDYPSAEILAVRGVSARAVVWWQTDSGRQERIAVDAYTLRSPFGLVHRVR